MKKDFKKLMFSNTDLCVDLKTTLISDRISWKEPTGMMASLVGDSGCNKGQLRKWVFRNFITFDEQTGLYTKTEEYLKGK